MDLKEMKSLESLLSGILFSEGLGKSSGFIPKLIALTYAGYCIKKYGIVDGYSGFLMHISADEKLQYFYNNGEIEKLWPYVEATLADSNLDVLSEYILHNRFEPAEWRHEAQTPESIINLAREVLCIQDNERVADLGTGQGAFIVSAYDRQPRANYFGIDINTDQTTIAHIRAKVLGENVRVEQGDMFQLDEPPFEKIFANYPFGMRLQGMRGGIDFLEKIKMQFPGLARATSSDWVFNLLIVSNLKKGGKAVAVMTNGSTWNSLDRPIREYFIREGLIESIIALPERMFEYTTISTTMVVFSHGNTSVRLVNAENLCLRGRRLNEFANEDIEKITYALDVDTEYSTTASLNEFKENDYQINPSRYLHKAEKVENGVLLGSVIRRITRGAPLNASELDELVSDKPTPMQYLMLANIRDGIIDNDLPFLKEIDQRYEKYCIKNNCLLLSKNGAPFKAAVARVPAGLKLLGNGNLYIIELDETKVDPYYLQAYFLSEKGFAALDSISVGASIPNISVEQLTQLAIPLLSMERQKEIAQRLSAKLDEIQVYRVKLSKATGDLKSIFTKE